jgi:hypothetical protein
MVVRDAHASFNETSIREEQRLGGGKSNLELKRKEESATPPR